uniref:Uncharacterized protein n=1 Tax=Aegilops tauschii subsp. strangulata TaxID=200361 RepID=A0A453H0P2_AEGTS
ICRELLLVLVGTSMLPRISFLTAIFQPRRNLGIFLLSYFRGPLFSCKNRMYH